MNNYSRLFDSEEFSDVTFTFPNQPNEKPLPAHRLILAELSPVFKTMFTSGLKESRESPIKIIECTAENFKCVIQFIYTGQVKNLSENLDNVTEILDMANRYELKKLKLKIDEVLSKKNDDYFKTNLSKMLIIAHLYNIPRVSNRVKNIYSNFTPSELYEFVIQFGV